MIFALLLAALDGTVTLEVSGDTIAGTLETALPSEPYALVSYLDALRSPSRTTDVDRLWDSPGAPEGTAFEWLEVRRGKRLFASFKARVPRRYGALGRGDEQTLLTAVFPFITVNERALPVEWRVHLSGDVKWLERPTSFQGDPSGFVLAFSARGYHYGTRPGIAQPAQAPRFSQEDRAAYPRSAPNYGFFDDAPAEQLGDAYEWLASALARFGVKPQRWVVGALRREPAVCGENALIVSRELFRVTPLDTILEFHRYGLARRALGCALKHAWGLSAEDADAAGFYLTRLLYKERESKMANPRDILRPISFIPDIDSLIYAPQMPWADVYFLAVDEPRYGPPLPGNFFHHRPPGKLLYEKLHDRDPNLEALFARALVEKKGISQVADTRQIERDFFGKYPAYDASFSVHGNAVTVRQEGAAVAEPVTVLVNDTERQTLPTGTGTLYFKAPVEEVQLDPDRRLVEYLLKPGEHPRFNNTSSHRLRVTLQRLSAALGFSASELSAGVDFGVRREFDLHHYFGFGADYDPSAVGVTGRYSYAFGPRITPDYLGYRIGTTLSLERLTQGFAGAESAVYNATLYGYMQYDDRPSDRTAMRGFGWQVLGAVGVPLSRTPFGYVGASVLKIFHLADAHGLVLRGRANVTIGDAPAQAKYSLGGRSNARGFPLGELTRSIRFTASTEYRHELARGFRASVADLVFIDGLEGALFADAVLIGDDWRTLVRYENLYYDVGYGIRILFDQLGVNPGVLSIDVGIPLKRYDYSRPPVSVFLDFVQSFAGL